MRLPIVWSLTIVAIVESFFVRWCETLLVSQFLPLPGGTLLFVRGRTNVGIIDSSSVKRNQVLSLRRSLPLENAALLNRHFPTRVTIASASDISLYIMVLSYFLSFLRWACVIMLWTFAAIAVISDVRIRRCRVLLWRWFLLLLRWN